MPFFGWFQWDGNNSSSSNNNITRNTLTQEIRYHIIMMWHYLKQKLKHLNSNQVSFYENHSKKIYKLQLLSDKVTNTNTNIALVENGSTLSENDEIAECFNSYFQRRRIRRGTGSTCPQDFSINKEVPFSCLEHAPFFLRKNVPSKCRAPPV